MEGVPAGRMPAGEQAKGSAMMKGKADMATTIRQPKPKAKVARTVPVRVKEPTLGERVDDLARRVLLLENAPLRRKP